MKLRILKRKRQRQRHKEREIEREREREREREGERSRNYKITGSGEFVHGIKFISSEIKWNFPSRPAVILAQRAPAQGPT